MLPRICPRAESHGVILAFKDAGVLVSWAICILWALHVTKPLPSKLVLDPAHDTRYSLAWLHLRVHMHTITQAVACSSKESVSLARGRGVRMLAPLQERVQID